MASNFDTIDGSLNMDLLTASSTLKADMMQRTPLVRFQSSEFVLWSATIYPWVIVNQVNHAVVD